jgi:hypothetical protein
LVRGVVEEVEGVEHVAGVMELKGKVFELDEEGEDEDVHVE